MRKRALLEIEPKTALITDPVTLFDCELIGGVAQVFTVGAIAGELASGCAWVTNLGT